MNGEKKKKRHVLTNGVSGPTEPISSLKDCHNNQARSIHNSSTNHNLKRIQIRVGFLLLVHTALGMVAEPRNSLCTGLVYISCVCLNIGQPIQHVPEELHQAGGGDAVLDVPSDP